MDMVENRGEFPIPQPLLIKIKELFDVDVPEYVSADEPEIDWNAKLKEAQERWASTYLKLNVGDSDADKKYRRQLFNK